jgi:hypothetical protein
LQLPLPADAAEAGGDYTVRGIVPLADGHDEDVLWLAEIVNPRRLLSGPNGRRRRTELCFRMSRFRPLRATNIDVFLQMLAPVPEREAVD